LSANVPLLNAANVFTANQTINGLLTVTGFGTHSFSASGAGFNVLQVRNPTAGGGNGSALYLGNDVTPYRGTLYSLSSTYTASGHYQPESLVIEGGGVNGMSIAAPNPSGAIRFYTGGSALRAMMAANGHMGLNTVPDAMASGQLNIETTGSNAIGIYVKGYSDAYAAVRGDHQVNSATAYAAFFYNGVAGNGQYIANSGAWVAYSDRSLKTDIEPLNVIDKLRQVSARSFRWKSHATSDRPNQRQYGFVAQEVEEVFPDLVTRAHDGKLGIAYTGLIAPLVQGWQNHDARIAALEERINAQ
jgi:hypothetical protein